MGFNKIKILGVWGLILLILPFVTAKYCGGEVECECGDTINEDYNFSQDITCAKGFKFENDVSVNCNGNNIFANNSEYAFFIYGKKKH
jgi:hypothetical protein